jgi:hypothetical protein
MSNKRPILNEYFFSDWVFLTALGIAGFTAFNNLSTSYFLDGNQGFSSNDLIAASIDAILQTYISFGVFVLIAGLIRRARSGVQLIEPEKAESNRRIKLNLTVIVVAIGALLAAYSDGASNNAVQDSKSTVLEATGFTPIALTCRPQGDDELCMSGLRTNTSATLNFELTYLTPRFSNGFEVAKSTWDLTIDCRAESFVAGNVKFFDVNSEEVLFGAEVIAAAEAGTQQTYEDSQSLMQLLSECG